MVQECVENMVAAVRQPKDLLLREVVHVSVVLRVEVNPRGRHGCGAGPHVLSARARQVVTFISNESGGPGKSCPGGETIHARLIGGPHFSPTCDIPVV